MGQWCQLQDTKNICFHRISVVFPKTNTINVNITDVNKHDPQIHVQLHVMGEQEGGREEKHFN